MTLRRRPALCLSRWLMLAGLVLGLLLQPTLTSIGELYELTHATASEHGMPAADAPEREGDAPGIATIHHVAHCCGHGVIVPAAALTLVAIRHREPVTQFRSPFVSSGRSLAPFRPPIAA